MEPLENKYTEGRNKDGYPVKSILFALLVGAALIVVALSL